MYINGNKSLNIKFGFTLAEVLITLVIIGVIAALVIPTTVAKYQKQETVSRLKKVYSTFSAATTRAITDYGYPTGWDFSNGDTASFAEKYITPYLSVLKICGTSDSDDCKFKFTSVSNEFDLSDKYKFILGDGTKVVFPHSNISGTLNYVYVVIDINGDKGPNKSGRDVFVFMYNFALPQAGEENQGRFITVYPVRDRASNMGSCRADASTSFGSVNYGCAALIMKDGWQIKDDYPW